MSRKEIKKNYKNYMEAKSQQRLAIKDTKLQELFKTNEKKASEYITNKYPMSRKIKKTSIELVKVMIEYFKSLGGKEYDEITVNMILNNIRTFKSFVKLASQV